MLLYLLMGIVLIQTIMLFVLTSKMSIGYKLIFNTLSVYWFLSYFLRPLFYIFANGRGIESALDDPRLNSEPFHLISIMAIIVFGNSLFCIILFFSSNISFLASSPIVINSRFQETPIVPIFYSGLLIGIISLVIEDTKFRNPFSKSLFPLATMTFLVYIWVRKQITFSVFNRCSIVFLGIVGTVFTSIRDNNSKGILLIPILIFFFQYTSKISQLGRIRLYTSIGLFVILFLPIFNWLQLNKLGEVSIRFANRNHEQFPWFMSPFLTLLQRFDQFARVSDSYFAGKQPLGGFSEWIGFIVTSLQWNPSSGRESLSFGQIWNQEVTNHSIVGSRLSNVSLAQGPIAEGYVWNGFSSLFLECLLVSILFIFVAKSLDGSIFRIFFSFGVIGSGRIFENGAVALSAGISSTLKYVVFLYLFAKIFLRPKSGYSHTEVFSKG